jgi:hypothetical protein
LRDSNEKDGWKIGRNLPSAAGAAGNKKGEPIRLSTG